MTLRLLLLEPNTVFTARVNQTTFEYPIVEVAYDTGVTFDDVLEGYTVFFGTSAGNDDLGRQRLRAGSTIGATGTLKFGRSSLGVMDGEVKLENDAYITVFELRNVWAKMPRIDDDGTIYKDEIAYSDQNASNYPVANAGIGFAKSLAGGTSINCDFDGTASVATADGATISSYLWDVNDGTITIGTVNSSAITANFPVGFRYVSLTVTDSNGKTHTCYVPVYCRDPNSDATIQNFTIQNKPRAIEGQELDVNIRDDIPASTYPNGTLVMLWEGEPTSNSDRSHMKFIGWHQTDPASIRAERTGTLQDTTLHCLDVAGRLKNLPGFPVEIISATSPANWGQMTAPNMDKYLHFILQWHSTALELADWTDSGTGSDYPFVILGSDGDSLWEQVQRRSKALVPDYWTTCNRFGQLQTVVDPMLQATGDRTATVQKALDAGNVREVSYEEQNYPRIHWLRAEAILADADTIDAIFCISPGEAPSQGLNEQTSGEQLAKSQADLNASEGHRYARLNAPQTMFTIMLSGSDDFDIEPADLTWVTVTIPASVAAQRGLTLSAERGLVHEINTTWQQGKTGLVKTHELLWERETVGEAAITDIPPVDNPPPDPDPGPWPDPEPDPGPLPGGIGDIVAVDTDGHQYVTNDFYTPSSAGGPTWSRDDLGLSGTVYSYRVDPFSPLYLGTGTDVNYWVITSSNIYYIEDAFGYSGAPTVTNQHTFSVTPTPANGRRAIWASFGNFNNNQAFVLAITYYGNTATRQGVWSITSQDGGATWGSEVQISGHYSSSTILGISAPAWASPRSAGKARSAAFIETAAIPDSDGYETTDYGATWARMSNPDYRPGTAMTAGLHVPWRDNSDESILYHGFRADGAGDDDRTKRVNGTTITDITPTDGSGRHYCARLEQFSIVTFDPDPRYVVLCGVANTDPDFAATFVSDNHGVSWTQVTDPASTEGSTPFPSGVAFAGDTPNTLYAWGFNGYIAYSDNYGETLDDRSGNLNDDWSPQRFIGIAGGAE